MTDKDKTELVGELLNLSKTAERIAVILAKGTNLSSTPKEKPKPDNFAFKPCIEIYHEFIKSRTGVGAKIDGAEGKAMKAIITYLRSQSKDNTENGVVDALQFVFQHWDRVEPFHRDQLKLTQINSNFINIISNIRNGKSSNTSEAKTSLNDLENSIKGK